MKLALAIAAVLAPVLAVATPASAQDANPAPTAQDLVDGNRVMAALRALPEARAGRSTPEDVAGLLETEEYVLTQLRGMGYDPITEDVARPERIARTTPPDAPTPRNIYVDLEGSGDLAKNTIILLAHIDAVSGSPGADDNGTGTAALLELARVLKDQPRRRSIRLLFTTLEEAGLIGARHHVRRTITPAIAEGDIIVDGALSLEMLGYFSDEPGSQQSPIPAIEGVYEPPDRGDFLALVGLRQHRDFTDVLANAMRRAEPEAKILQADFFGFAAPDIMRSDHAEFWRLGLPAAMFTDTANFRNPHYHQASDTIETIDRARYIRAVRQVAGAVQELSMLKDWPKAPPLAVPGADPDPRR
ncbi:MAG: M20/M25/M40 family metallo-hydrolase [Planctomycetota bacterium]